MMGVTARVLVGDVRDRLAGVEAGSVQTCVTSPPYWGLRDYGNDGQIGLEGTPEEFVESLCLVFDEVWRVLADDGTLWLNLGDSYAAQRGGSYQPAETLAGGVSGVASDGSKTNRGRGEGYSPARNASAIGLKHKDLVGIPWRVAFALQARGWFLRSEIIWHKPNPMPESVTDRPTKSHEHIFLLAKSAKYFYDHEAIKEPVSESSLERAKYAFHSDAPSTKNNALGDKQGIHVDQMGTRFVNPSGRNKRDVWTVPTKGYDGAHFAVYPTALIEPCILAGSREGDTVLDPFSGSGTTGVVALRNGRNYLGCELNPEYAELSRKRISDDCGMFGEVTVDE
jgi:DNA modification methylase